MERVYTLRHQTAGDAVALIYPLLSERGAVEVRSGGNTVVIRDLPQSVARIVALLDDFDRPARPIRLSIQIVSAAVGPAGEEPSHDGISDELAQRLRELLRYTRFRRLGLAELDVSQGLAVRHELGGAYRVEFETGRLEADRRLRLEGFRVLRRAVDRPEEALIHTNLNLRLEKPMVLGLARTEASQTALMVVLEGAVVSAEEAP